MSVYADDKEVYDPRSKYLPMLIVAVVVVSVVIAARTIPIDEPRTNNVVYIESEKYSDHFDFSTDSLFDFNSFELKKDAADLISTFSNRLNEREDVSSILVIGHTDSIGSLEYNLQLSRKRAVAVRNRILEVVKLQSQNVKAVGLGADIQVPGTEQCKADPNLEKRKDCERPNRRVEIWYRSNKDQNTQ